MIIPKKINDYISYIPASEGPLSADVGIVMGKQFTYLYDVGADPEVADYLKQLPNKAAIISHFHPDHLGNIKTLEDYRLFVSNHTFKYTHSGEVVDNKIVIDDGVHISLMCTPSSHSKGSLIMNVNNEVTFLGDSIYSCTKSILNPETGEKELCRVMNAQQLAEQIKLLESINTEMFFVSHEKNPLYPKKIIIGFLKKLLGTNKTGFFQVGKILS